MKNVGGVHSQMTRDDLVVDTQCRHHATESVLLCLGDTVKKRLHPVEFEDVERFAAPTLSSLPFPQQFQGLGVSIVPMESDGTDFAFQFALLSKSLRKQAGTCGSPFGEVLLVARAQIHEW